MSRLGGAKEFLLDVVEGVRMSFVGLWYFLPHGQLHPEYYGPLPKPEKAVRLWDKDFNLIHSFTADSPFWVSEDGSEWSLELVGAGSEGRSIVYRSKEWPQPEYTLEPPRTWWERWGFESDPYDFNEPPPINWAEWFGSVPLSPWLIYKEEDESGLLSVEDIESIPAMPVEEYKPRVPWGLDDTTPWKLPVNPFDPGWSFPEFWHGGRIGFKGLDGNIYTEDMTAEQVQQLFQGAPLVKVEKDPKVAALDKLKAVQRDLGLGYLLADLPAITVKREDIEEPEFTLESLAKAAQEVHWQAFIQHEDAKLMEALQMPGINGYPLLNRTFGPYHPSPWIEDEFKWDIAIGDNEEHIIRSEN